LSISAKGVTGRHGRGASIEAAHFGHERSVKEQNANEQLSNSIEVEKRPPNMTRKEFRAAVELLTDRLQGAGLREDCAAPLAEVVARAESRYLDAG
jgi:hypothetical protein